MLYAHIYNSPVGDISLLKDDIDLIGVSFSNQIFCDRKARNDKKTFKIVTDQLNEYFFEGRKNFTIQYKLPFTGFRSEVFEEMIKIPYGERVTYSNLAKKVGNPKAYRAVGSSCGKNPLPLVIPCHRVVSKSGLGGFTGGLDIKRFLLELESN
tara:strand:+ start:721 stop:1179 length:459 start_codon:yes stop_codon:yes gene_type:complete